MIPYWTNGRATLWQGHVLDVLPQLDAESVQCIITSPPYWGLRDYGIEGVEWPTVRYAPMSGLAEIEVPGCAEGCDHVWGETLPAPKESHTGEGGNHGAFHGGTDPREYRAGNGGSYCQRCGGWRGSYGLEPTIEMYVAHTVAICRELRRVLRDDGTVWWNLGDSYAGGKQGRGDHDIHIRIRGNPGDGLINAPPGKQRVPPAGLKPKDLIMIPARVALALQADGWWLRSDIIWAKGVSFCPTYSGSCMPESVRDRPTNSYEHVFLLAKSKRYFYDGDAVREAPTGSYTPTRIKTWGDRVDEGHYSATDEWQRPEAPCRKGTGDSFQMAPPAAGRNLRSVWTINPGSYPGSHFATFPPKLVEPMIKAGTSARGCCSRCGSPLERVTERATSTPGQSPGYNRDSGARNDGDRAGHWTDATTTTTGWTPTCSCDAGDPVPATVLDPFGGSGTTAEVAIRLGRKATLIELSKPYCDDHIIPRLSVGIQMELL